MRTLLLIAVLATFASVTTSAEAQWLRSRRTSECANGQCGLNSVAPAADQDTAESQPAADAVPSSPAAPAPAPEASPAAEAPAAPATNQTRTASVSSSRTRSANDAGAGRRWRRIRSRL
jgi:type IV secretory pathway VirB10-like protein